MAICCGLLLWSCESEQSHFLRVFRSISVEVATGSTAYHTLQELCQQFGPRLAGSTGASQAEELTYLLFRSYGIEQVYFQPFTFNQWGRGTVQLLVDTAGVSLPMNALAFAYTPTASASGQLVDVGNGLIEDYQDKDVTGKIALFYLGVLPDSPEGTQSPNRSIKTALAIAQGAIGVIGISTNPDNLCVTGRASLDDALLPIPAASIGHDDGFALKEALRKKPCHASLSMTNTYGQANARNVVAHIEGSQWPKETIVVGAHLDSWDISPGALDNASGSVTVLDMARTFQALNLNPKRSIDFVLFSAEEEGHFGSQLYVEEADRLNRLEGIRYMFNHDMTVNTHGVNLMNRYESEDFFKEIGQIIRQVDSTYTVAPAHFTYLSSDHAPFVFQGIPAFTPLCRFDNSFSTYHTRNDEASLITEEGLQSSVRVSAIWLYALASASRLPASRFSPELVRQYLIDNNLQEDLVISGEWIWD